MKPPVTPTIERLLSAFTLLFLLSSYLLLRSYSFDYFPIWDARSYYDVILEAQARPFDLLNYAVANHNSQAWTLLSGLQHAIIPYNIYAYNAWCALLGALSVAAFYGIIHYVVGQRLRDAEKILLAALFAFHPTILSNYVHVTADTGMLIFWTWYLLALLKSWRRSSIIAGCLLLFSKEPAMVHLPVLFVFAALMQPSKSRGHWIWQHKAALLLPYGLLVLLVLYKAAYEVDLYFMQASGTAFLHIGLDESLFTYAKVALLLNYSWVIVVCIAITLVFILNKHKRLGEKRCEYVACLWLIAGTLFTVLVVRQSPNARYIMPFTAALILVYAFCLQYWRDSMMRLGVLLVMVLMMAFQNLHSFDPVGKYFFCRADFGKREVLVLEPVETGCTPGGRIPRLHGDRFVNNLEFLYVPKLLAYAFDDIGRTGEISVVLEEEYNYQFIFWRGKSGMFTTAELEGQPRIFAISSLERWQQVESLPDTLYYIEYPTTQSLNNRAKLYAHYNKATAKHYSINGYEITIYRFSGLFTGDWCDAL